MMTDPVLAILALLLLWLLVRIRTPQKGGAADPGRSDVRIRGRKGVKTIESLPPRPLAFGATMSVPDDSEGGPYTVDLSELSCTCQDFRRHREDLPSDAIGRVCSHVSRALRTTGATSSMDDLVRAIVESGPTRKTYYEIPLGPNQRVAVGHTPGSDRLDVFAPVESRKGKPGALPGGYLQFGYSRAGKRWIKDKGPPGSDLIGEAIQDLPLGS